MHNDLDMGMIASLIIRTFQLVFLAGTVFFSHNKSVGTVFYLVFSAKRTGPWSLKPEMPLVVESLGNW